VATPQFTVVKTTTGANIGYAAPGNGLHTGDFPTLEVVTIPNVLIDELEIKLALATILFAISVCL
jgi:hypothetical protein